jgi:hypothetical protein
MRTYVRSAAKTAEVAGSVCTGALILGSVGLLEGRQATTHWAFYNVLEELGAEYVRKRWVEDSKFIFSAGVSAGIDMALQLAARLTDEETARRVQRSLGYDPHPPFGGIDYDHLGAMANTMRAGLSVAAPLIKLRDEKDLDALSDDLGGVARETMQPPYASLWLRAETPWRSDQHWLFPTLGVLPAVLSLAYPTVGALIASWHPRNSIGWLFCAAGLVVIGLSFATAYADYAIFARSSPALPAAQYMAWLADRDILSTAPYYLGQRLPEGACSATKDICEWWERSSGIALPAMLVVLTLLFLLFPEGRLPSRKWLVAALTALIGSVLVTLWWTTEPGPLFFYPSIDNPFGIKGDIRHVVEGWGKVGWLVGWASLVASGLSWVTRWIQAEGEEYQQMKWFAYSLLLIVFAYPISPQVLLMPALTLLPIAVGIAILKYRLYDIDVIINRTLVYGSLTATLVALYFVGIVVLQRLFVVLTGQQSTLAVVASTLLIAALFTPLRRRIQSFIDRRFYRRKYDARKTLEVFSTKLKHETDLESLNNDLVGVVRETMQPAHVSLWLRPETAPKGGQTE